MARSFSGTDVINCGSGGSLDDVTAGTVIIWFTPTATTNGRLFFGKTTGTVHFLRQVTNGINLRWERATTHLDVEATTANLTGYGTNKWVFLAVVWDTSSVSNSDQHIYSGDRVTPAVEAAAYAVRNVGSGNVTSDAAQDFRIGNNSGGTASLPASIGYFQFLNRVLSLGEIRALQFQLHKVPGTVGLWIPGWDNGGTVPDLSGNGNSGTISGTTLTADVPVLGSFNSAAPSGDAYVVAAATDFFYYNLLLASH